MNTELKADAVFTGMEQCSTATGISMDLLKCCKVHPDGIDGLNGFHQSGRIYWDKLKPWIDEHEDELKGSAASDYIKWRAIKMEGEAKLVQIELHERKKRLVNREEVHQLLKRISNAQSSLLNSKFRQELVSKMVGKSEQECQLLMDGAISDYMALMQKGIDAWK